MPTKPSSALRFRNTSHPILYEINIRVLLNELSADAGEKITLDKIPDSLIDEWAECGFNAIWLMGVWSAGKLGVKIAREHAALSETYKRALPDLSDEDVVGSPYAVHAYTISQSLGGAKALQTFRKKLDKKRIGLVLDYVCNHTARDNKWVTTHPEYYIGGSEGEETEMPDYYFRTRTESGARTIAFGRDPYYSGWTDTAQLNPRHPDARAAMIETLLGIADQCDGVRCDMAMLLLNEVYLNSWRERSVPANAEPVESEFWKDAIDVVRMKFPGFLFIAEAYWNLEWQLQQLGFNFTYDKTLYDRLLKEGASSVYDHLKAEIAYQQHLTRFVENHDEPRIAQVLPSEPWQYAAAAVAATVPGMLMLHEGQLVGRKVKVPVQLGRRPAEEVSVPTRTFYNKLLSCLKDEVIRNGEWRLLPVHAGWHDNYSYQNILSFSWRKESSLRLIVVNYAPLNSQAYVEINAELLYGITGASFEFRDLMSLTVYVRDRLGLQNKGMYFDLAGYGLHIFEVKPAR